MISVLPPPVQQMTPIFVLSMCEPFVRYSKSDPLVAVFVKSHETVMLYSFNAPMAHITSYLYPPYLI
jgi:hypothetical protein